MFVKGRTGRLAPDHRAAVGHNDPERASGVAGGLGWEAWGVWGVAIVLRRAMGGNPYRLIGTAVCGPACTVVWTCHYP